ncbi:TonB-dependent receptor plug domain-containing protein [Breoghania sp.]|uniref:TonB-dependent receptor n=1 Tax=Breoghania sp. TaxID=2065378 RepID=UPI00261E187E|nr:TonB-dependent receptor plug domain-containing protein [Breoghania sp.]MDJ0932871.1 TonB-dependent receptor plug domain-containing protein [Breoghania sp.]
MYKLTAIAGAFALASTSLANAEDYIEDEPVQLDTILVTAGLTPIEKDKSGHAYTVITGKELEEHDVRYVADALRMVPGFAVSRTGSYGGPTQIRVRRTEANHLLVMIDEVEAGELSTGEYDFSNLIVDNIDRIEVRTMRMCGRAAYHQRRRRWRWLWSRIWCRVTSLPARTE